MARKRDETVHHATRIRIFVAVALGVAITAFMLAEFRGFELWSTPGDPFVLYRLTLTDPHLDVVHVRGEVFGSKARVAPLRALAGEQGARLDPIGFIATGPLGEKLAVRARDGRWLVDNGGRDFAFEYDVSLTIEDHYSPDIRDMMTLLDADRCRILGRDVFLVPELIVANGIIVDVEAYSGRPLSASSACVGNRVIVSDLAELPFTMAASGNYRRLARNVGGSSIVLAIGGSWSFSDEELFEVVCRIVSKEISLFGACPRARYLFVCDGNPVKGGGRFDYYGIHYGGSMILLLDRKLDASELMDTPMVIIAHEFFHNWNGEALGPADKDFLWFTEGVTNYVSYHILREASVITSDQYENRRLAIFERYHANPYAARVSIGEAANSDMRDKDMVNLLYDGGFLAAEALDGRLRADTGGNVTLIDVLKRMYENAHGGGTVDEASFLAAARGLAGVDLSSFMRVLVHSSDPKPLARRASSLE